MREGSVLTGVGSWRQDLVLRAVAGVFVRLEQEKATGSGRLLLHGVVVCFGEVQTWPLRACGRESQLGRGVHLHDEEAM